MGWTYVMSDIHGMGDLLEHMLDKIGFSGEDRLYVLGDMIDRGPSPAKVLDIVSGNSNIIALKGNHEDGFVDWYEKADLERDQYYYNTYDIWMDSGVTVQKIPEYVRFMERLPLYKKVKMAGTCFLLAHASTEEIFKFVKKKERFLWDSSMVDRKRGIPGYISVVGHVPTFIIRGYPKEPAQIWYSEDGRLIDVDCGAAFAPLGGRLGCLCLENFQESYVWEKDGQLLYETALGRGAV